MLPRHGYGNYGLLVVLAFGLLVVAVSALFPRTPATVAAGEVTAGAVAVGGDSESATFYVQCYDVGKAALEGLPGVHKVTRGFLHFKEINTVTYDPTLTSPAAMTAALKAAGTYLGTAGR